MKTNRHFLCGIVMLALTFSARAQHSEPVLLNVHYQFSHMYDVNSPDKFYKKHMVLHIGETNSQYTDGEAEEQLQAARKAAKEAGQNPQRTVVGRLIGMVKSIPEDQFFQLPFEKKLVQLSNLGMAYYFVESPLPVIKWKIENETKRIDTFTCQKAVGVFGGRTYTAWFTTQLPFKGGPWKLNGLPGVILEAKDSKNEVVFAFKDISKGEPDQTIYSPSDRPIRVDEKTFARARQMYWDDPAGVLAGQMPDYKANTPIYYRGPDGALVKGDAVKEAILNDKKVNNNPLELTKK